MYIKDLQKQIKILQDIISNIQEECSHPYSCLKCVDKGDTGKYDPSCDSYWTEYHCLLCDKKWIVEEEL